MQLCVKKMHGHVRSSILLVLVMAASFASCGSGPSVNAYMSIDTGTRKRTVFYTDSQNINCVAELVGAKDGLTVFASVKQIRSDQNKPEQLVFQIGEFPANKDTTKLIFSLAHSGNPNLPAEQNADPWPPGGYECDVSVDGVQRAIAPFAIEVPRCPLYPAQQGARCVGYYPIGTQCPGVDQTKACTCSGDTGTWSCP